jgi:hypothetical protein
VEFVLAPWVYTIRLLFTCSVAGERVMDEKSAIDSVRVEVDWIQFKIIGASSTGREIVSFDLP